MATINPFQGPINYAVDVQSPFEAAIGGFKIGAAGAEAQAQAKAREQALQVQTDLKALYNNPNATGADYDRVAAFLPKDQAAIVTQGFERKTKAQQESDLRMGAEVYSAIKSGKPDVAIQRLTDSAAAFRNSGREQDAKAAEASAEAIKINPTGAQATVGLYMAKLPGGTSYLEAADKALSTVRAEALQPATLKKGVADADKAVADAQKAQIDAKYAEQITLKDLEKKAADLGLTKAQTGSALAQTKKLGLESQKSALELEALKATGGLDPTKTFEQEEKLRKEYQTRTKEYGALGTTYQTIKTSAQSKNGPGDIALITGFMKMIDPGAIVRETDFALARDTAGLLQELKNQAGKLESGAIFTLDSKQRKEYVDLAAQYLEAAKKKADQDKKALGVVVKNYKLNDENVFGPETAAPPPTPSPNSVIVNGQTFNRPANFTDAQWSAYKQSMGVQ